MGPGELYCVLIIAIVQINDEYKKCIICKNIIRVWKCWISQTAIHLETMSVSGSNSGKSFLEGWKIHDLTAYKNNTKTYFKIMFIEEVFN